MEQIIVEATPREDRGKNAARRMRVAGQLPAVLYGGNTEPVTLAVNAKQVAGILRSASGHNTIFKVQLGNQQQSAILKDWQVDPVKGSLLHVDLLRIAMDVRMRVKVPVHTFGEPQGVKLQGGIFEMVTREVEVECLPTEIPTEFRVDVTELMIGNHLRAADLPMDSEKVKLVTDPARVIAHVVALRAEEEKPAEVVAATEAVPAEPELIKKGKKETEEGAEAAAPAEEKPKEKEKKK
ncbi:MAG TPA: 50S ribosomal protein L25 [Candidatus Dormibacteraeota bacterium]|nr:50S ribosomal protein L25 [Candidatus Dormibacteraeota bacterium]